MIEARTFPYMTVTGADPISINTSVLDGVRIIPMHIVVFGVAISDSVNSAFRGIVKTVISVLSLPIQLVNYLADISAVANMQIPQDGKVCFW